MTNGTATTTSTSNTSPQVPAVRPPLREALYTMGPNGPLFTSIASHSLPSSISEKLPSHLSLPTSTGGSFTASSTSIIPNNPSHVSTKRTLLDSERKRNTFGNRKRGDFSDDGLGKVEGTKWLDWGSYASFAPDWDDGGGVVGAETVALDWAYKRLRRERRRQQQTKTEAVEEPVEEGTMAIDESIDEKLVLEWEGNGPSRDLVDGELVMDDKEMTIDETLDGLRQMILLLGQMQTLRMAMGKLEIPEDEKSLGIHSI